MTHLPTDGRRLGRTRRLRCRWPLAAGRWGSGGRRAPTAVAAAVTVALVACSDAVPTPGPTSPTAISSPPVTSPTGIDWVVVHAPPGTPEAAWTARLEDAARTAAVQMDRVSLRQLVPDAPPFRRDLVLFAAETGADWVCAVGRGALGDVAAAVANYPALRACAVGETSDRVPARVVAVALPWASVGELAGVAAAASVPADDPDPTVAVLTGAGALPELTSAVGGGARGVRAEVAVRTVRVEDDLGTALDGVDVVVVGPEVAPDTVLEVLRSLPVVGVDPALLDSDLELVAVVGPDLEAVVAAAVAHLSAGDLGVAVAPAGVVVLPGRRYDAARAAVEAAVGRLAR